MGIFKSFIIAQMNVPVLSHVCQQAVGRVASQIFKLVWSSHKSAQKMRIVPVCDINYFYFVLVLLIIITLAYSDFVFL